MSAPSTPYMFLFGKHPPPLAVVREHVLDPFCRDRGTLRAEDLPELDLSREWWFVSRSAFARLMLAVHAAGRPADEVEPFCTLLQYYRKKPRCAWQTRLRTRRFTFADFHHWLRQCTAPHGLMWCKTVNYMGVYEISAFYVAFPKEQEDV